MKIDSGVYISNIEKYSANDKDSELLADVNQADVIIVDEIVDMLDNESVNNIASLCRKLKSSGAQRIILCAPHIVQSSESKRLIDLWPIEEIVTTDSIELPANCSLKIKQLPIAKLIAKIIQTEIKYQDGTLDKIRAADDAVEETFEVE
jgi:ribose-phosphate pyrophosphokinase